MNKKFLISFCAAGLLLGLCVSARADDFQSWNRFQVKAIDTKYVDYVNYWEMRFGKDASNLNLWLTSQELQFDFFKYLGLGVNYTYLENKVSNAQKTGNEFKYQHRLELEAIPRWQWKDHFSVKNRNRIEFRWIESRGSDNTRFRDLLEFDIPLKKIPVIKSLYANDEVFIDFQRETINENRIVPLGVTLGISRFADLKVFYMVQSAKGSEWTVSHILGTHLSIHF